MTQQTERAYWAQKMDEAWEFMEAMRHYPIEECGEPMVSLKEAADGLDVIFSTTLINECHPRVFYCREKLIPQFINATKAINERGWILKVEDAYRSPEMQRDQSRNPKNFDLVLKKTIWELGGAIPEPSFLMRRMAALIASRCRVGTHVSGSAIDISVYDRETGKEIPRGGQGTQYIEISHRTPMDSPFITEQERNNRQTITTIFRQHGWCEYPWEFWHYNSGDSYHEYLSGSGKPARYGPIAFDGKSSTPIPDPESDALLNSEEYYHDQIQAALVRLQNSNEANQNS